MSFTISFLCIIPLEESKCHKGKEHMDQNEVDHQKRLNMCQKREKRLKNDRYL